MFPAAVRSKKDAKRSIYMQIIFPKPQEAKVLIREGFDRGIVSLAK